MNKKNFARVVRRISKSDKWDQTRSPFPHECSSSYCFVGHAEFIRSGGKRVESRSTFFLFSPKHPLTKWLGLTGEQMDAVYSSSNTLVTFKRWLKKGRVE